MLPEYLTVISHAGKRTTESRPLWPGYLLTQFDAQIDNFAAIGRTQGVIRLVCTNGARPIPIAQNFMDDLMLRLKVGNGRVKLDSDPDRPQFKQNDPVKIVDGSFAGHIGIYDAKKSDRDRVVLFLNGVLGGITISAPRRFAQKAA